MKYGRIEWTSGANAGQKVDIGNYNPSDIFVGTMGLISQRLLTAEPIQVGDVCTLREGCDNTYETCGFHYSNRKNFGGWHLIPGPTRAGQSARVIWS